jgi:hypothetical protein
VSLRVSISVGNIMSKCALLNNHMVLNTSIPLKIGVQRLNVNIFYEIEGTAFHARISDKAT